MAKEQVTQATTKELEAGRQRDIARAHAQVADDLFEDLAIDSTDIIIPKLLLMQGMSQFVADDKAKLGDYVNSVTGERLGSVVEPIEIIPFYHRKSLDILNADENNERIRNEEFTPANATLPWTDVEAGVNIKRVKRLDFFCLVPATLAKGSILPMVVSFRSTGYKAGASILTAWMETRERNRIAKEQGRLADVQLPFHQSFVLSGQKLTNDKKQTYVVPAVQIGKAVPEDQQRMCLDWFQTVKTSKAIKVDETDEGMASGPEASVEAAGTGKY